MSFHSAQIAEKILKAKSFILTTHKSPDADGLACVLAFHWALSEKKKKVQSILVDSPPPRYDFMGHQGLVEIFDDNKKIEAFDLALVFDTSDPKMLEPLYAKLKKARGEILFIDHHLGHHLGSSQGGSALVDEGASSTGELCYELLQQINTPIDQKTARALYTSIVFDTGLFRGSKNLAKAFDVCSKLYDDIGPHNIYEKLFCSFSRAEWKQTLSVLTKAQFMEGGQIGWIEMDAPALKTKGLKLFHLLDALDFLMKVKTVKAGVLAIEKSPGLYKVSLRGKWGVDVFSAAKFFGGGGHRQSAGFSVKGPLPKEALLEKLKENF